MSETRRNTLRVLSAAGALTALPLGAQTPGQHDHEAAKPPAPAAPYNPIVFNAAEMALVSKLTDLIIPETDTPGAAAAGVPAYIDTALSRAPQNQAAFRAGLALVESTARAKYNKSFLEAGEAAQIELLTPWSDAADRKDLATDGAKFFRTLKGLTVDGYYGSYQGLVTELGYKGNVALAAFSGCEHEH